MTILLIDFSPRGVPDCVRFWTKCRAHMRVNGHREALKKEEPVNARSVLMGICGHRTFSFTLESFAVT